MELKHYIAALLVIGALNWGAARFALPQARKLVFLASAAMPLVLWIGLMAFLLVRDGASTFQGRYFSIVLMVAGGCTVLTTAAALLGQVLGRPRSRSQP